MLDESAWKYQWLQEAVVQESPCRTITHPHTHIHKPTESLHWYKSSSCRHCQEDFSRLVWMSGRLQQYIVSPLISFTNHRLSLFKHLLSSFLRVHLSLFLAYFSLPPVFFSFTPHLLTPLCLSLLYLCDTIGELLHAPVVLSGREHERLVFLQWMHSLVTHHPNKFASNYFFPNIHTCGIIKLIQISFISMSAPCFFFPTNAAWKREGKKTNHPYTRHFNPYLLQ